MIDPILSSKEKLAAENYSTTHAAYISFLKQKSKLHWLVDGDSNTSFFHQSIKMRRLHNSIYSIQSSKGVVLSNPDDTAFVEYYQELLGSCDMVRSFGS